MTAKTDILRVRISPELKDSVKKILEKLGLSPSEAINIYFRQIEMEQGIPFEVKIPNKETIETFEKTDAGEDLHYAENTEDLFNQLEN